MHDDLDLLRRFARNRSEEAFAELVRRHVNLVYSAALRQVRSPQLVEEVAQSVFTDLASEAARLKSGTVLAAWLYQVTRRTAIDVVRREARRQLREQVAVEMNAMNSTSSDWAQVEPLLDDAMAALDDTDRTAILLRYFENKSLRDVGLALGTSDDTAQKRVSRAVDKLREFFAKRGVTVGASGLVVVISANAVQAAPLGLAAAVSSCAAMAGTTLATQAITTSHTIAMTTIQKTIYAATLAAAVSTGVYEAQRASRLQRELDAPPAQVGQVNQLQQERDAFAKRLAAAQREVEQLQRDAADIHRLRGEVTGLRQQTNELAKLRADNHRLQASITTAGQRSPPATPPPSSAQGFYPKESWNFAGYADPESAFQSSVWAMSKGDLKTILASVTSDERARMEKEFAGKSGDEFTAQVSREMEKIKGFRILKKETLSDDAMVLTIFGEGKDETLKLKFQRVGNEWKIAGRAGKD